MFAAADEGSTVPREPKEGTSEHKKKNDVDTATRACDIAAAALANETVALALESSLMRIRFLRDNTPEEVEESVSNHEDVAPDKSPKRSSLRADRTPEKIGEGPDGVNTPGSTTSFGEADLSPVKGAKSGDSPHSQPSNPHRKGSQPTSVESDGSAPPSIADSDSSSSLLANTPRARSGVNDTIGALEGEGDSAINTSKPARSDTNANEEGEEKEESAFVYERDQTSRTHVHETTNGSPTVGTHSLRRRRREAPESATRPSLLSQFLHQVASDVSENFAKSRGFSPSKKKVSNTDIFSNPAGTKARSQGVLLNENTPIPSISSALLSPTVETILQPFVERVNKSLAPQLTAARRDLGALGGLSSSSLSSSPAPTRDSPHSTTKAHFAERYREARRAPSSSTSPTRSVFSLSALVRHGDAKRNTKKSLTSEATESVLTQRPRTAPTSGLLAPLASAEEASFVSTTATTTSTTLPREVHTYLTLRREGTDPRSAAQISPSGVVLARTHSRPRCLAAGRVVGLSPSRPDTTYSTIPYRANEGSDSSAGGMSGISTRLVGGNRAPSQRKAFPIVTGSSPQQRAELRLTAEAFSKGKRVIAGTQQRAARGESENNYNSPSFRGGPSMIESGSGVGGSPTVAALRRAVANASQSPCDEGGGVGGVVGVLFMGEPNTSTGVSSGTVGTAGRISSSKPKRSIGDGRVLYRVPTT